MLIKPVDIKLLTQPMNSQILNIPRLKKREGPAPSGFMTYRAARLCRATCNQPGWMLENSPRVITS
mgnify:CR=1 FL=1